MATKQAAAKRAPAKKKAAAKKAPVKKAAAKKAPVKKASNPITEKMSKGQIVTAISDGVGLSKKQVADVIDELHSLMERSIKKRGIGEFTIPGIMKISTVKKPAKKARKGINPFTGLEQVFKAKPASIAVKIRPLKKLKEFASS